MMNRDLFWKLLEPEHPRAEAFCRKLAGSVDDGDDLYQEALFNAMRRFGSLREEESFRPWLYRIIVNCFKNQRRQPWWRRRVNSERAGFYNHLTYDPEAQLVARRWLERGLAALKPKDRVLIVLFELEGWSVSALAELFATPEGTIKSRLTRSRGKMRAALAGFLSKEKNQKDLNCEVDYAMPGSETSTQ